MPGAATTAGTKRVHHAGLMRFWCAETGGSNTRNGFSKLLSDKLRCNDVQSMVFDIPI